MKIKKLKTGKTIDNAEWLVFDSYDKMYEFIYKNLNGRFLKSQMLNKDWLDEICSYLREYLKEEYLGDHIFFKKRKTRYKG